MPDQHIDVQPDAIRDGDDGTPILTHEMAQQERNRWTAEHPPVPGLRWRISWRITVDRRAEVKDRWLEVIPGWEDAYAPSVRVKPTGTRKHDVTTKQSEANRLGALAYHGWFSALPESVRESGTTWDDLGESFREPLRQAAILVWQHAENAGFHEALLRTLPSAQLGAAGTLEDLGDFLSAMSRLHGASYGLTDVFAEINRRVATLRRKSDDGARRAREQKTD